jgi:NAD-dependent SIR2 family protein deacetylase
MYQEIIERAARAISNADALLIGAGAGMGVDSGLPDFRGPIKRGDFMDTGCIFIEKQFLMRDSI